MFWLFHTHTHTRFYDSSSPEDEGSTPAHTFRWDKQRIRLSHLSLMSERLQTNPNCVTAAVSALLEQTPPPSPNLVRQRLDVNGGGVSRLPLLTPARPRSHRSKDPEIIHKLKDKVTELGFLPPVHVDRLPVIIVFWADVSLRSSSLEAAARFSCFDRNAARSDPDVEACCNHANATSRCRLPALRWPSRR